MSGQPLFLEKLIKRNIELFKVDHSQCIKTFLRTFMRENTYWNVKYHSLQCVFTNFQ